MSETARGSRQIIYIVSAFMVVFAVWAANAPLEEIVRASGKVSPATNTQLIQNLEGGIIREISVAEGDVVEQNQLIAKMDDTQFRSSVDELSEQRLALKIRLERLSAEFEGRGYTPSLSPQDAGYDLAMSELALFEARKIEKDSSLQNAQQAVDLQKEEAAIQSAMLEKQAVPEIDVLRAQQAVTDAEGRVTSILGEFENSRAREYSETLGQLKQVEQQLKIREDQLLRTDILAPVRGVVNRVSATTIGGVVRPGEEIMEIIPLDQDLRVKARVDPRDIGFVFVDMPATVKLTAFDYSIYGALEGHVVHVGADTVTDDQRRDIPPYFEVFVAVSSQSLEGPDGLVEIRPGMLADVELKSGEKTVLEYLFKPLLKATDAFSER